MTDRQITASELVEIVMLKDGDDAAAAFVASIPEGFDMSTVVATCDNIVTLRCDVCHACEELDVDISSWFAGMVHPRPKGWKSFECIGEGYQDGVFDVCRDCVVLSHIIVDLTGGDVDHDMIAEWKASQ